MPLIRSFLTSYLPQAALLLASLAAPGPAAAAPIFRASAGGDGCESQTVTNTGSPALASSSQSSCAYTFGWGSSMARATSNGLGASAEWFTICCGSASSGGGLASVQTEFIIIGPPGPVLVSLNLALHGTVGGGTVNGFSERRIDMGVTMGGLSWAGFIDEDAGPTGTVLSTGGNLVLPSGSCATPCSVATPQVELAANFWYGLTLTLNASVSGNSNSYGRATAFDSLTFPLNADVFTLPPGYTAQIDGMNVVNNRVVGLDEPGGGEVPEPSTFALLAAPLALLGLVKRRGKPTPREPRA